MPFDRFIVAPVKDTGLQLNVRPWLIPDQAFSYLQNAYAWRGRVRKRWGTIYMNSLDNDQYHSRLRIALTGGSGVGMTDGSGNASGTVPGTLFLDGQTFTIGNQIFTVDVIGTPATMLNTGSGTGTYNTDTGAYVFTGVTADTQIYWYPSQPVMGLLTYETSQKPTYAFDTQFSYQYLSGEWTRLGSAVWSGDDVDYFWGTTYRGITSDEQFFFVSNFVVADGIKYWDGSAWNVLNPIYNNAGDTIVTAKIILPFANYLLLLNTVETVSSTNTFYVNRLRFSAQGSPIPASGYNPWNEQVPGLGGYIDNQYTSEAIVAAEFIKDRLIVYFEASTYELAPTGNTVVPFQWNKINTELGSESTFSTIAFDRAVLGIAEVGIHSCNGSNVERIDTKIPNIVWDIENGNFGPTQVYGIRDYYLELAYWTYPDSIEQTDFATFFPTKVLIYNYQNDSWALFRDTFTCFGYFTDPLATYLPTVSQVVLAGNQQGYVLVVDPDVPRNAGALQITQITPGNPTTIVSELHNYISGEYVLIENCEGITTLNGNIYEVTYVSVDTFTINATTSGSYTGGGTIARVSNIQINSKEFNPYVDKGRNVYIQKIDFQIDNTGNGTYPSGGQVQIDYFSSTSTESMVTDGTTTGTILGTSVLETGPYNPLYYPLEETQTRLWHPIYFQSDGEFIQFNIYMNPTQMMNPAISLTDFQLHGFVIHSMGTSSRLE